MATASIETIRNSGGYWYAYFTGRQSDMAGAYPTEAGAIAALLLKQPHQMPERPQDVPFWPDYVRRVLGGPVKWVLAQRLTDALQRKGHEIAIHPKRYERMRAEHAAEVRAAVIGRLEDVVSEGIEENATPAEIVACLLEDPGLRLVTCHDERRMHEIRDAAPAKR
jgi:hypothetical protein